MSGCVGFLRRFALTVRSLSPVRARFVCKVSPRAVATFAASSVEARRATFEGIPSGVSAATTDADGKFTLEIPRTGQFGLVARASRQLLKGKETYSWLVWVDLDGEPSKHLNLSNSNMLPR